MEVIDQIQDSYGLGLRGNGISETIDFELVFMFG